MPVKEFTKFVNKNKHIYTKEKYDFFGFNCNDWSYAAMRHMFGEDKDLPR